MSDTASSSWRTVIASSAVMSVALLGDALLYAVLPLHADAFGVSLVWVGLLLSANRIVRVFAYGAIARLTERIGERAICVVASVSAVVATGAYGLAEGEVALLFARVLWGLAYAALVLATLAYAVSERETVGVRVGWSRAIQRLGPIAALLGGTWLVSLVGPRDVFVWLAVLTALAIPLAFSLPDLKVTTPAKARRSLSKPNSVDIIFALQGAGVDGVFALSITLLLAQSMPATSALAIGGALLAMRHVGEAVASPIFGALADRYGARAVFTISVGLTAAGFVAVSLDFIIAGALTLLIFRGALAVLGPAVIVQAAGADEPVMGDLANMQAWRDLGAAAGPTLTGALLAIYSAQWLHGVTAVLMLLSLGAWLMSSRRAQRK